MAPFVPRELNRSAAARLGDYCSQGQVADYIDRPDFHEALTQLVSSFMVMRQPLLYPEQIPPFRDYPQPLKNLILGQTVEEAISSYSIESLVTSGEIAA